MNPIAFLLLASAVEWRPWSAEVFDQARRHSRPVFVWVGAARDAPPVGDGVGAKVLASRFVAVRVDRDERPDVADLLRLSLATLSDAVATEADGSAWLALTPDGRPLAGGSLGSALPALGDGLEGIADDYRARRSEAEARAGVAAARIVLAQVSEPARSPLGRAVVEHALRGARDAGGASTPGTVRLLLAEQGRIGTSTAALALTQVLDLLARTADTPRSPQGEAFLLRAFAQGHAATGSGSYRKAAETVATRLSQAPRDDAGAFTAAVDDGRVFAAWNGLAIGALAVSASALGREDDRREAVRAAEGVISRLGPWSRLVRCAGGSGHCGAAFLEDYAFLAEGLLDLEEATGDPRWRTETSAAAEAAIARFLDSSSGGFFDTDDAHGPLPARLRNGYDTGRPSANGVMASVLLRLSRATGEKRYADLARGTVQSFLGDLERTPKGMETLAACAVALVGTPGPGSASEPLHPSTETRGPVTVDVSLSLAQAPANGAFEARVRLVSADGWAVNGPRPPAGLVPLTISVPGTHLVTGRARFPDGAAYAGEVVVVVPLRVRAGARPGPAPARLSVRYQACRGALCEAPESLILEAPFEIEAARR